MTMLLQVFLSSSRRCGGSRHAASVVSTMTAGVGSSGRGSQSTRGLATRRKVQTAGSKHLPASVLQNLPVIEEVSPDPPTHPAAYRRNPVTSAHCIDVAAQQVSLQDSAALSPSGSVVHGRYGELGPVASAGTIPLEYLALLRPAAEGAAGLRTLLGSDPNKKGTIVVYGASTAAGWAACQLASSAGHAVVGVVGGEHAGNETLMESLKGMIAEPGTAVPESFALNKKHFADLVQGISSGDEGLESGASAEEFLAEFKKNYHDYAEAFPETRPAAVSSKVTEFKYMEKDREHWDENMEAYLEQFAPGAPAVDAAALETNFTATQYEIFRNKFWKQTTGVISGDDTPFSAAHLVKQQSEMPETMDEYMASASSASDFPFAFSILNPLFPANTSPPAGGPILGALICASPNLVVAAKTVAAAGPSRRAKAEALQFLTKAQRAAYGAACSVAAQAGSAPIVAVGGEIPEIKTTAAVTDADVQEALQAMDIDENGETRLNYFVQVYRASDFPFYADYAVHRASEELAGPRQIIVTK